MKINPSIFKSYDLRGLVPDELNGEVAFATARAFAEFLPGTGAVAVGRDMRPDSEELAREFIRGLSESGRDVVDIGLVTSDMIYFTVGNFEYAGGAMITASHNPGSYNGIKFCGRNAAGISLETGLAEIRDKAISGIFKNAEKKGEVSTKDVSHEWVNHALSFVEPSKWPKYRIAVDAGNGMAGSIIPILEPLVPLQITPLYFELDGTFPNHPANPLVFENLKELIEKVLAEKLDFGIAFDGDGDRAVLVDEAGNAVTGSIMTAMLAEYFLKKFPGSKITYDLRCSHIVSEVIKANGGTPVRTKVGHSNIKAVMKEKNAAFGGELSGHFYFRDNWFADSGLIAALVAIEVLASSGQKLSDLTKKYQKYFHSGEINSTVGDSVAKVEELKEKYSDGKQDFLDGLTVEYADWWFNVRASNTEPLLRLNVEANSKKLMEQKRDELLGFITR